MEYTTAEKLVGTSKPNDGLVGDIEALEEIFPNEKSRPSIRTFREWRARRLYPYYKIRGRVFLSVPEVRAALDRNFIVSSR